MMPYWTNGRATVYQGHALDVLSEMESQSAHMAATSPPFYGLRDYGIKGVEWPAVSYAPMAGLAEIDIAGCAEGCVHVWGEVQPEHHPGQVAQTNTGNPIAAREGQTAGSGQYCQLCGGWRGSLGLEPDVQMYVGHLVLIFRELRRVLRDDGTFWLNLGDSYATNPGNGRGGESVAGGKPHRSGQDKTGALPAKNLIGIPWRVALALQADGWWLRSDIIWAKGVSFCPTYSGSCMPESVRDRPTNSYEHVFLLTKSKRYFYDGDAVREPHADPSRGNGHAESSNSHAWKNLEKGQTWVPAKREYNPAGRNLRSVWTINPGNFPGSHFATFPPKLVEPMIRAGTSVRGVCPKCKAPWMRVTERQGGDAGESLDRPKGKVAAKAKQGGHGTSTSTLSISGKDGGWNGRGTKVTTTGWTPTCICNAGDPVPATVLDPFAGTATTLDVAIRLGRRGIGIELSQTYCDEHIIPRLSAGLQMELL